mgnify:FL=1
METAACSEKESAAGVQPLKTKNNLSKKQRKKYLFVYLMLLPAFINFAIFYVGINVNSFVMAFQHPVGVGGDGFLIEYGFTNFIRIFRELAVPTNNLTIGLNNTLLYFITNILITVPLSYLFSYFLYKKMWGYKFFRVVFFLPSIIPGLVYVSSFREVLNFGGPIDVMWVALFGENLPPLLSDPSTATWTIVFFCIWTGFGVNLLLYQGAMGRIPEEVIEAGKLDGVSWVREMFQIVTPMIWTTLSTTIVLALSKIFTSTGPIVLFDENDSARTYEMWTISYWIFNQTYSTTAVEYPAAVSIFFTILSFPFVMFVRWFFNKIDPEVSY